MYATSKLLTQLKHFNISTFFGKPKYIECIAQTVDFLFFFHRNKRDPEGRNLFLTCVTDLAIECRDYDLIFGKMQRSNIRSRGLIDQFESIEIDVRKACEMVADELVKKGLFEDAVKLYDLSEVFSSFVDSPNSARIQFIIFH